MQVAEHKGLERCDGCGDWVERSVHITANAKRLTLCWRCVFRILAVASVYAASE